MEIPQPPQPEVKPKSNNKLVVIIVLLALLLGAALIWQKQSEKSAEKQRPLEAEGNILERAEKNQLIEGFSREFIADENAAVIDSVEGKSAKPGFKMLVTFYESDLTVEQIAQKYEELFAGQDWEVLDKDLITEHATFFARQKPSGETLQIAAILNENKGVVTVQVEYLKKSN